MTSFGMIARRALAVAAVAAVPAVATAGDPIATVLADYAKIHDALARDSIDGVSAAATRISESARSMKAPEGFVGLPKQLAAAAQKVAQAKDLAAARQSFAELSQPLVDWAKRTKPQGLVVVHCSMADASWLQAATPIRNPYYGSQMLACGEVLSAAGDGAGPHKTVGCPHGEAACRRDAHSGHGGH